LISSSERASPSSAASRTRRCSVRYSHPAGAPWPLERWQHIGANCGARRAARSRAG
jgi:hypothetical protein